MNFRDEFSLPQDLIYLNNGTMAFSPKAVLAAVSEEKQIIECNPAISLFNAWEKMWDVQRNLSQFLKCRPQDMYLRLNVTYAMNDFIMALELPTACEILISSLEYGAIVNICKYKAELEGHTVRSMYVPARGPGLNALTEESFLIDFEKQLTPKVGLVMFSHVCTGSGFVFPVEKMAAICRAKKIVFAVDGAHGAGSRPIDLSKTQMDFYGSNLHKWLMGPKGTGMGWVAESIRPRLKPKFAGWTTYNVAPHHAVFGGGDPWTTRWMISSTHNFSDFYGINETLNFWNRHGPEEIFARQAELRNCLVNVVGKKTGWECLSMPAPAFRGPLVAFALPTSLASRGFELMRYLLKEKNLSIVVTQLEGEWAMRLSAQIYNSEHEIERAAGILAGL